MDLLTLPSFKLHHHMLLLSNRGNLIKQESVLEMEKQRETRESFSWQAAGLVNEGGGKKTTTPMKFQLCPLLFELLVNYH